MISAFAANNSISGRRFVSFVEGSSEKTTHSDMLDVANKQVDFISPEERFMKRAAARQALASHLRSKIMSIAKTLRA